MNELVEAKGVMGKRKHTWIPIGSKKKSTYQFNQYNQIKQDWSSRVCLHVKRKGFTPVESCFFHYFVVENTIKRDPSNIFASSVKFIEDGLQEAGVIPNDGWKNVLGIQCYHHLDREEDCGVLCVMANDRISYNGMLSFYNEYKQVKNEVP